ncbi:Ig-like domain-containing protein [Agromyces sp. LHK192]|uniref:Ig-like domain-containing protein n=1 Tax=Agromyces sp. LHK192 TaxID=2498704 RepID=UPI000FDADEF8|nr:Ig-like domain-containing protein [Agromyces sp. LHK192]
MIRKTIAVGGVAGLALAAAGIALPAQAETLAEWDFSQTRATGHYERTADGLHIWTEGATSTDKVAGYLGVDLALADVTSGSVDYTATEGVAPGAQFVVDVTGDGKGDGILVGESVYGQNWWLTGGSSQALKDLDPSGAENGGNGSEWFGTLAQWSAAAPNARLVQVGFSLGSGVKGDGVVHAVVAGSHRYDFDPYTVATCDAVTTLAPVTDAALGDWIVKPGVTPTWKNGSMKLTATASGSAWAMANLPADTRLADLARLAANGERSGIWWGGIILEGGDLTQQLHYDDDGRFWTAQSGIFPEASLKGGYYESRNLAADLQSNPKIGSIKVYVNAGANSITLTSVDHGCFTQPFTKLVTAPIITKLLADGSVVAGKQTFTVELQDENISYTYLELNRNGTWLTDNTKAPGSSNSGLKPKLVIDTAAYPDGAYQLKINAIDQDGLSANRVVPFTIDNTKPAVTIDSPVAAAHLKGVVPVQVTLGDANLKSYNLRLDNDGLAYAHQATNGAQPAFSWDTKTVADGEHTLLATATDLAGNKSTTTIKVVVDNTRPTFTIVDPAEGAAFAASEGVVVNAQVADAFGLDKPVVNLYQDGKLLKSLGAQATGGAAGWSGSWALPAGLADGTYTLKAGVNDLAGNNRTVTRTIVIDSSLSEGGDGGEGDGEGEPAPAPAPYLAIDTVNTVPGGTVQVTGANFGDGEEVELELHSTPVALGTVTAGADGSIAFTATIPTTTPTGSHHVVAVLADGSTIEVPIEVSAAPVATAGSATASTGNAAAGLASTGFDGLTASVIALATMLLGGAAIAVTMLRRRAAARD